MKFEIHGKSYFLPEKVCTGQDELISPILLDVIEHNDDVLKELSKAISAGIKATKEHVDVSIPAMMAAFGENFILDAIKLLKVILWAQSRGYAKKALAILLIPEGEEFDPDKVGDLEKEMIHAPREVLIEVIGSFFTKSGNSGVSTSSSSAAAASETRP